MKQLRAGKSAANSRENRQRGGTRGRRAEDVALIGVSKTHPASAIREAYEAGIRHFGENRVQEWEGSARERMVGATWHLIGHCRA